MGDRVVICKKGFNTYEKIIKCFPYGDDILKSYKNLDNNKKNTILLSKEDYKEVKIIFDNMNTNIDYKKQAMIEAGAILLSYEYYQNYILELDPDGSIEYLFDTYIKMYNSYFEKYKKEILTRTIKILKEKYKVNVEKV